MRRLWLVGLAVLLVTYLRWLTPALAPFAGGADASGYLWSARLFRHATLSVPIDVPRGFPIDIVGPDAFAPLGTRAKPGTRDLVPTYPTGLPLHIAAASVFLSEEAAVRSVLVATVAGTLLLLFSLARECGLGRWWAIAACLVMACSPLTLFIAVQPLSDLLATLWTEAALVCAWRARHRGIFAVLAGVSLGVATLVRPTNALLLAPLLITLPPRKSDYARAIVGALPFGLFMAAYQAWTYGHPFASGYGEVSSAFSVANAGATVAHYARWIPRLASWLVVFAPAALWGWSGALSRWRFIAIAWVGLLFGVYALYPVTSETWWSLRFVLPAFPLRIVASLVGLRTVAQAAIARGVPEPLAAGFAFAVVCTCLVTFATRPESATFRGVRDSERVYQDALKVIAVNGPPTQTVLMVQMSGAAVYYAPQLRTLRYDALSADGWRAIRAWQALEHAAVGAALFPFEGDELFGKKRTILPCRWQPRGHYRHVTFWECPP